MRSVRRPSSSSSHRSGIVFCLVFISLFARGELFAEEKKETKTPAAGSAVVSESPTKPRMTEAAREKRKEDTINTVYVLLLGIILMLVALFTIVLLGGSWARRIARTPLPPVKRPDELWYLKNPEEAEPQQEDDHPPVPPASDET